MKKEERLSRLPAFVWDKITINFTLSELTIVRVACRDFYFPLTEVWDSRLLKSWDLVSVYTNCNSYWSSSHIIFRTQNGRLFAYTQDPSSVGLPNNQKVSLVQLALPPARDVHCQTDTTWVSCFNNQSYQIEGRTVSDECDHYIAYTGTSFVQSPITPENSECYIQRRINLAYLYNQGPLYVERTHYNIRAQRYQTVYQLVHERVKCIESFKEGLLILSLEDDLYFIDERTLHDVRTQIPALVKCEGFPKVSHFFSDLDTVFFQRGDDLSVLESLFPAKENNLCTMPSLKQVLRIKHSVFLLSTNGNVFRRSLDQQNEPQRIAKDVKQLIRDGHDRDKLFLLYYSGKLVCLQENGQESLIANNVCQVIAEPQTEAGYKIRTNVIEYNDGTLDFLGGSNLQWKNTIGRDCSANFSDFQLPAIRFFNQRRLAGLEVIQKRAPIPETQEDSDKNSVHNLYGEFSLKILISKHLTEELRRDFVRVFELMKPAMIVYQSKHHGNLIPPISWFSIGKKMVDHYLNHEALDLETIQGEIIFLLNNSQVETVSPGQSIAPIIQRMFHLESQEASRSVLTSSR